MTTKHQHGRDCKLLQDDVDMVLWQCNDGHQRGLIKTEPRKPRVFKA